jgi:co-chaperonin GroES (HSP10)
MKTLDLFVVELEKRVNDTITTDSGLELYIDTRFEMGEFNNRITEGPVVCAPVKHNTGVKEGDTLYFHHHVVINDGQPLTGNDNNYIVRFDPKHTIGNQAIAFKCKDTGEVKPIGGWALLESVDQEDEFVSDVIEVIELNDKLPRKGRVSFDAPWLEELGVKKGDIVGFVKNADYRIKIDGKEHYRTRTEDLLYVEK